MEIICIRKYSESLIEGKKYYTDRIDDNLCIVNEKYYVFSLNFKTIPENRDIIINIILDDK